MRIGLVTDIHLRDAVPGLCGIPARLSREMTRMLPICLADLHARGVGMILVAGDLVDDGSHPQAALDLKRIRAWLDETGLPSASIPGNHDPYPDAFYRVFEKPPLCTRIGDCELISFSEDTCPSGDESERSNEALQTMRERLGSPGSEVRHTILLQHYLVFPERREGYPYNYRNDEAILAILEASPRRIFSISGHYHAGIPPILHRNVTYFCGKALCEAPHAWYVLETDGDTISVEECFALEG